MRTCSQQQGRQWGTAGVQGEPPPESVACRRRLALPGEAATPPLPCGAPREAPLSFLTAPSAAAAAVSMAAGATAGATAAEGATMGCRAASCTGRGAVPGASSAAAGRGSAGELLELRTMVVVGVLLAANAGTSASSAAAKGLAGSAGLPSAMLEGRPAAEVTTRAWEPARELSAAVLAGSPSEAARVAPAQSNLAGGQRGHCPDGSLLVQLGALRCAWPCVSAWQHACLRAGVQLSSSAEAAWQPHQRRTAGTQEGAGAVQKGCNTHHSMTCWNRPLLSICVFAGT